MSAWQKAREARGARLQAGAGLAKGKIVEARDATALLEAVIRPGDRVCLEGDNQKQADLLASALAAVDIGEVHDPHMVQSCVVLPEHLDVFESGVAKRLDYAYSGPQSARIAKMLFGGKIELGAVHTYLELFARYFIDLTPHVALIAAISADRDGNLYTGPNTEDTPTVVEATAFKDGVVIAQVNQIVDAVPRVDIPGDCVHFVVKADKPFYVEPLFNLLHRGGLSGLRFAQRAARGFLDGGGVGRRDWRERAHAVHRAFVARRLSPGGSADLLAMSLFVQACEAA